MMKRNWQAVGGFVGLGLLAVSAASFAQPQEESRAKLEPLIEMNVVVDALDAITEELLDRFICNGHEQINVWMAADEEHENLIRLLYLVPGKIQVYREGYVQHDGLVILADDIDFHDRETRWSTRKASDDEFKVANATWPIHVQASIPEFLSERQRQRMAERKYRTERLMSGP